MFELILVVISAVLGGFVGWKTREIYAVRGIQRILEQSIRQNISQVKTIPVGIEHHGDQFYVYNAINGHFLAQGKTHNEIASILNKQYPDTTFIADASVLREIGYDHDSI